MISSRYTTNKQASTATTPDSGSSSHEADRGCTVESALREAREVLGSARTAALDAQLLLGHVLGHERSWVLSHPEGVLTKAERARYSASIAERARGVPVAYLRGYSEWFGLRLRVTPDVLVPRPETELLVEYAASVARERGARTVADIGTGSGAIALAMALQLPEVAVFGVDVSREALAVAGFNAAALQLSDRITWLQGNLLEPLLSPPDLLVANLPYLSDSMMRDLDQDVRHEPELALHGGKTGLELYDRMFQQRRERGWRMPVVLELDPRQSGPLTHLLGTTFSESSMRIHGDYAGHDRIMIVGA